MKGQHELGRSHACHSCSPLPYPLAGGCCDGARGYGKKIIIKNRVVELSFSDAFNAERGYITIPYENTSQLEFRDRRWY